jgi:hypothetical protein
LTREISKKKFCPEELLSAETVMKTQLSPKSDNMPRVQETKPCGECGKNVTGECTCDVCGAWMHSFHGICFGDEELTSTRRCKHHDFPVDAVPHEEQKGPQSQSVRKEQEWRLSLRRTKHSQEAHQGKRKQLLYHLPKIGPSSKVDTSS